MSLKITITVHSSDGVEITESYEGGSDNSRFYADYTLVQGHKLVSQVARQFAKLAELEGGALYNSVTTATMAARLDTHPGQEM